MFQGKSLTIRFQDLAQEFGKEFLKVSEYFLKTNLRLLYVSSFYIFWNWRILMVDCKTVSFFLKISKEIGLTRAELASLTPP